MVKVSNHVLKTFLFNNRLYPAQLTLHPAPTKLCTFQCINPMTMLMTMTMIIVIIRDLGLTSSVWYLDTKAHSNGTVMTQVHRDSVNWGSTLSMSSGICSSTGKHVTLQAPATESHCRHGLQQGFPTLFWTDTPPSILVDRWHPHRSWSNSNLILFD